MENIKIKGCKSEIEWNDLTEFPEEGPVLILSKYRGSFCVEACYYSSDGGGFYNPHDWREYVYTEVVAWAYFPKVYILEYDTSGKSHVFTSEATC
jgi:hypothetical protein